MSPVPTKNSSAQPKDDNIQISERKKGRRGRKDVQGTTLMRFLAELQTSDRSSMMTTIELSTGNSLSILFCVRPTQQEQFRWSVATYCAPSRAVLEERKEEGERTAALVPRQDPISKVPPEGVDQPADLVGVQSGSHRVYVHFVLCVHQL